MHLYSAGANGLSILRYQRSSASFDKQVTNAILPNDNSRFDNHYFGAVSNRVSGTTMTSEGKISSRTLKKVD